MKHVAARTVARPAAACAAAALLGLSSLALAQGAAAPATPKKSAESPAKIKSEGSYSLGVSVGQNLRQMSIGPDAVSTQRLLQGLRDALAGKAKYGPANQTSVRAMIVAARAQIGDENHAAARTFLARNGKKKGIVSTASGLQYEVLKAGQGDMPKPGDTVSVNYRGTLLDGTEFDSSYKRGEPATFPVDRVIPGWQEALKLMQPGAKWRLWVPPSLAYDLNSPPPIPPGSLLVFDVDLLGIKAPQPLPPPPPGPPHP